MCVCRQCGCVAFASLKIALFIQLLKKGTTHFFAFGSFLYLFFVICTTDVVLSVPGLYRVQFVLESQQLLLYCLEAVYHIAVCLGGFHATSVLHLLLGAG